MNFSAGDALGPHDGTSALETAIDAVVMARPGRAVVKSAGNEGASGRHAEVPLKIGGLKDLILHVTDGEGSERLFEAWYPGNARVSATVIVPVNPRRTTREIPPGDAEPDFVINPNAPFDDQTTLGIITQVVATNGKNLLSFSIRPNSQPIPTGDWVIRLRNTGPVDTTMQVWLDRDGKKETRFDIIARRDRPNDHDAGHRPTSHHRRGVSKQGRGPVPSRQGRPRFVFEPRPARVGARARRPDGARPGRSRRRHHVGQERRSRDLVLRMLRDAYKGEQDNTGTSIAAPHVAGVVALMLQRHPRAHGRPGFARSFATPRIARPGFTGPRTDDELNSFGFGRVNAVAAVQQVPPFFGGPPPAPHEPRRRAGAPRAPASRFAGAERVARPGEGAAAENVHAGARSSPASRRSATRSPCCARAPVADEGRLCAVLVSRHFSEARALIRANRRVAVAWHRATGPRSCERLSAGSCGTTASARPAACRRSARGFRRFLALLARYGSAGLRADIARTATVRDADPLALDRLRIVDPAA